MRGRTLLAALFMALVTTALVAKAQPQRRQTAWAKTLGDRHRDVAHAVAISPSGEIVVAGSTEEPCIGGSGFFGVVKLDPNGNVVWQRVLGGRDDDVAYAVAVGPSGEIVAVGVTCSFGAGAGDFWIIKLPAVARCPTAHSAPSPLLCLKYFS